jgi:hypothetical protein
MEGFLDINFSDEEGKLLSGFKNDLQTELNGLKELILEGKKAEEMLRDIESNRAVLERITSAMDEIETNEGVMPAGGLPESILKIVGDYTGIDFVYSMPEKREEADDPRKGKAKELKNAIVSMLLEDIDYEAAGIEKESLPSFTKVLTPDLDAMDSEYIDVNDKVPAIAVSNSEDVVYKGDLENVGDEPTFTMRKVSFRRMHLSLSLI